MARPATKTDLINAATTNYEKMNVIIAELTETELSTPFDFTEDEKKKKHIGYGIIIFETF